MNYRTCQFFCALAFATLVVGSQAQVAPDASLHTGAVEKRTAQLEKQLANGGDPRTQLETTAPLLGQLLWSYSAGGNFAAADSLSDAIDGWIGAAGNPQNRYEGTASGNWPLRRAQYHHLVNKGHLVAAEATLDAALTHLAPTADSLAKAEALTLKAWSYYHAGRFADAAAPLENAKVLLEGFVPGLAAGEERPPKSLEHAYHLAADWYLASAAVQAGSGQHTAAEAALSDFLNTQTGWARFMGGGSYPVVTAQWLRAHNADLAELPALAEDLYETALKSAARFYGKRHAVTLARTARYGHYLARHSPATSYGEGRYGKTLIGLERDLTKLEKAARKAGRTSLPIAQSAFLVELGQLYHQLGNHESAKRCAQFILDAVQATDSSGPLLQRALAYRLFTDADIAQQRLTNARLYANAYRGFIETYYGDQSAEFAYARIQQARIELLAFELKAAQQHAEAALALDRKHLSASHRYYIQDLSTYAKVLIGASEFQQALTVLQEVLRGEEALYGQQSYPWVEARKAQGRTALLLGDFNAADTHLSAARAQAETLPGNAAPLQADILELLAQVYQGKGQFEQSQATYLQAMRLRRRKVANDPALQATSIVGLATLYRDQGRYSDAIKVLSEAVALMERGGRTDKTYLEALATLASIYQQTGDYQAAERYALQYRDLVVKTAGPESLEFGQALALLAAIGTELGRYAEAQAYLDAAEPLYLNYYGANNLNTAALLADRGVNAYLLGNPDIALGNLTRALAVAESAVGTQHLAYAGIQSRLAQLYISLRDYSTADTLLRQVQAVQLAVLGDDHPDYWRTTGQFAALYKLTERYKESERLYRDLLGAWKKILGEAHPDYAFYQSDYADLLFRIGDERGARKVYFEANQALVQQVNAYFPALSEQEKAAFWARISRKLERYYAFVAVNGTADPAIAEDAYNLRLQTKALLLATSTAIRGQILASGDKELIELFQSWQTRREYLAKLYTLSKEELKEQGADVDAIEGEVNELEKELSLRSDVFARGRSEEAPTWQAVRGKLGGSEAAVEVIRVQTGTSAVEDSVVYLVMVVKPGYKSPEVVVLPNGNQLERRYLLNYSRSISNRFNDELSYGKFWEPLEPALGSALVVYFSADGVYNKLSLPALKRPDGTHLIDHRTIRLVANTKDLLTARKRTFYEGRTAMLVGNPTFQAAANEGDFIIPPLVGTAKEIERVAGLLETGGWQTAILTEEKANEALLKAATSPKLLHVATHGFFYPKVVQASGSLLGVQAGKAAQNPLLRAGLFLAGAGETLSERENAVATTSPGGTIGENGIITAYEVLNMNLNETELVILSACETGLGEIRNGEGVYGLQRAFSVAGAGAVVMSLWRVNDEVTQEMIAQFYTNWVARGQDLHTAFKAAQQQVRARYPEAYYWGAFVMVGS